MDLSSQFGGAYAGRRVLLTGHTGFKGSWLALWLGELGAQVTGVALDPDTRPAHWTELALHGMDDRRADVREGPALHAVVHEASPEIVFHLAAQPLVRRGYREPKATFDTNVMGVVNLLDAVRSTPSVRGVVVVTTDKVYQDDRRGRPYVETDRLGGHDPYAASKACAELVVNCYRSSFFNDDAGSAHIVTARSGNVIGGGDWSEDRLIPDCVRALESGIPLLLRYPESVRPWQHVLDALSGYLLLGAALLQPGPAIGEAFNFGPPSDSMSVRGLVTRLQTAWPALKVESDLTALVPAETAVLRLDGGRAERELGWWPAWNIERAVQRTVDWYSKYLHDGTLASLDDLEAYSRDACAGGVRWASMEQRAMPGDAIAARG